MQFYFFSDWKGNNCCNTTRCKPTQEKKKTQINYVKWNQPNKKWKLDVFTVQSSHHLWNAKCYSQETEAQLLHVLPDCTRALWAEKSLMKSIFLTNGCLHKLPGRAGDYGCGTGAHSDAGILLLAFGARQCCLCLQSHQEKSPFHMSQFVSNSTEKPFWFQHQLLWFSIEHLDYNTGGGESCPSAVNSCMSLEEC